MKLKNLLVALTSLSAVVVPLAAHAGTTASPNTGKISNLSGMGPRQSAAVRGKQKADGAVIALVSVGAAAAGYGIYRAVEDNKSMGS